MKRGPSHAVVAAISAAWHWWTRVARRIGDVQARVLLSVFYYLVLGPFAIVVRRSDPLGVVPGAGRGWRPRDAATSSIAEQARRQS